LRWFGHDVLLFLPVDRPQERKLWRGRLRGLDRHATARGAEGCEVRLTLQIPPDGPGDEPGDLEGDIRDYLDAPNMELLIPPWSQMWALPDVERFRKARRTLRRLQGLRAEAVRGVKFEPPRGGLFGGNREDILEQDRVRKQQIEAEYQRLLKEIRAEGDDTVDRPMLTLWETFSKLTERALRPPDNGQDGLAAFVRQRNSLLQEMAQRMGSLPLKGNRPEPGSDLSAVRSGRIVSRDGKLNLFVNFRYAHEGLPALADWLTQRADVQLRYEFLKGQRPEEDES
jgi:hypothetical protein